MTKIALTFKIASEHWEFEQIHQLNYKAFVEEIPQHSHNAKQVLVDKFHDQNTYLICLEGTMLVGMVAVRDQRPFSLDNKIERLDTFLPSHQSIFEIRLLVIEKAYRKKHILGGLMFQLTCYRDEKNHDLAVISGTLRQSRLYGRLGFKNFGPVVGDADAQYQPMYLDLPTFKRLKVEMKAFAKINAPAKEIVNLLPGPVTTTRSVQDAFKEEPVSHRSTEFMQKFAQTQSLLCKLVSCQFVELLMSSGTMANDAVAAQLSLLKQPGVVLTNGEFGDRLIDHANRFGLAFEVIRSDWGEAIDLQNIQKLLKTKTDIAWLWSVHCETSSGVLNNIEQLQAICDKHDVNLCLDCTSSIGCVPVNLSHVYLASSVSGKALRSFTGVAMVFYNRPISPTPNKLARYLDLGLYAETDGVPFTISSNLVYALKQALEECTPARFEKTAMLSKYLRAELAEVGLQLVGQADQVSPAVITVSLPEGIGSGNVGDQLKNNGYLLSYESRYLQERNWIQICLMGEPTQTEIQPLVGLLKTTLLQET